VFSNDSFLVVLKEMDGGEGGASTESLSFSFPSDLGPFPSLPSRRVVLSLEMKLTF